MAEKSKRATTSVPRTRERKATSKESKEPKAASKTVSKATSKTAASKTTAAANKTVQKDVKVSSTSATSKKVSKKTAEATETKPKASSKKAKAAVAPAPVEAPATEAAPATQAEAPVEPIAAVEPVEPAAAPVEAMEPAPAVVEAKVEEAPADEVADEPKAPEPQPAAARVEEAAPVAPVKERKSKRASSAEKVAAVEVKEETKVKAKAEAKAETKVEVKEAEPEAREEVKVEEAPADEVADEPKAETQEVEAKEDAKEEAKAETKEAVPAPPAETPSVAAKKSAKKERKKAVKETSSSRTQAPLLKNYQFIGVPSFKGQVFESKPAAPPPPPPVRRPLTLEERLELLQARFAQLSEPVRKQIQDQLDMSWIYHDSALEGVVYSYQELKTALGPDQTLVQESNLQPVIDEIRRHRAAIELVREYAKKRAPVTVDVVKKIYLTLHPEEGDLKTLKYRKDIPQHRLYFHDYAPPDKIAAKVRQIIDWVNEPEAQKGRNALRVAARAHYDLLRTFPFTNDSGKVARLLMNLLLLQAGYEPAIIHSTERQRYYEALKGSAPTIIQMVVEAEENAVMSLEKLLDERSRLRSFG